MFIVIQEQISTDIIMMDSVTSFSESFSGSVTSHPIEDGSKITDHTIIDNVKLKLSGVVSDYNFANPLKSAFAFTAQDNLFNSAKNMRVGVDGLPVVNTSNIAAKYSQEFIKYKLKDIHNKKQFVNILCYNNDSSLSYFYENCIITSLDFKEDENTGYAIYPEIGFEQVKLVDVKIEKVKKERIPLIKVAGQASGTDDKGIQSSCGEITSDPPDTHPNAATTVKVHIENGIKTTTTIIKRANGTTSTQVKTEPYKPTVPKGTKVQKGCDPATAEDIKKASEQTAAQSLGAFLRRISDDNIAEEARIRKATADRRKELEALKGK